MRRLYVPLLVVLTLAGCQGASDGTVSQPASSSLIASHPDGCLFVAQGGVDFAALLKGIDQHTVTPADVNSDLAHIAGHLSDAATIATGSLKHAASDGALRARQMRADFAGTGPGHLTATTHKLSADFNVMHGICL